MSLILLAILMTADSVLTYFVLQRGGRELNPIVKWLMNKFGQVPALAGSKAIVFLLFVAAYPHWLLWVACAFYAGVTAWNAYQWRKSNP